MSNHDLAILQYRLPGRPLSYIVVQKALTKIAAANIVQKRAAVVATVKEALAARDKAEKQTVVEATVKEALAKRNTAKRLLRILVLWRLQRISVQWRLQNILI